MKKRVALLGIYHETNTFSPQLTTLEDFRSGYWLESEAIVSEYRGAHHEISGIIEVLEQEKAIELVPVFYAYATPGGMVTHQALNTIMETMFGLLTENGPYDGMMVVPHGAGVSEKQPDMDGYWLGRLRELVGSAVPVIGTLDAHANLSPAMVAATNALFPYQTNPHVDQALTGRKAAKLMVEWLLMGRRVWQHLLQLPVAISIEQQNTSEDPCRALLREAETIQKDEGLHAVNLLLGFPYADVREMGSAFVLIADEPSDSFRDATARLQEYVGLHMASFDGKKPDIDYWIGQLRTMEGPVLLLDMGDNVGGGSTAGSTFLLEALDSAGIPGTFVCLYDPEAVQLILSGSLSSGGKIRVGENGYEVTVTAFRTIDGRFTETEPKHGGFVNYYMGDAAIVETSLGQTLMLTSLRTVPFSLRQLTTYGLDPATFRVVVAKGVNAPIAAYLDVCKFICKVDTPGLTSADMTRFHFKNRRKPLFPFEKTDLSAIVNITDTEKC